MAATESEHARRIALFGGAFDPVHCAHLRAARAAVRKASLDRVVFVPAARSPLKAHAPRADDADRLEMLRLAMEGAPCFAVDDFELRRGGVSYSVETVRYFRNKEPGAELFWILGADQFERLEAWHAIGDLAAMVGFLVLARPGFSLRPPAVDGLWFEKIEAPLMEESSSAIRDRCRRGESLKDWLPRSVEAFISERNLYKGDFD